MCASAVLLPVQIEPVMPLACAIPNRHQKFPPFGCQAMNLDLERKDSRRFLSVPQTVRSSFKFSRVYFMRDLSFNPELILASLNLVLNEY